MRMHTGPATLIVNPERRQRFIDALTDAYTDLFKTPGYAAVATRMTPGAFAIKMTDGMITGDANHDGEGIKRACIRHGIRHTRKAIREYLSGFAAGGYGE